MPASKKGDRLASWESCANSQILAGIGPRGLQELNVQHPLKEMSWYNNPRFSLLVKASEEIVKKSLKTDGGATTEAGSCSTVERIRGKLAQLLFIAVQDIDVKTSITDCGIDSMVAAEFRKWVFASFGKQLSTLDILDAGNSIANIENEIARASDA